MDHHLVADLPARDLLAHLPDDAGRIRSGDVIVLPVHVKRADRLAKTGPDPVVVDACRHHEDENLLAVDLPGVDHFLLKRHLRLAVPFPPDRPGIHLFGHMAERGHFADFIKVLFGRVIWRDAGIGVQGHAPSPVRYAAMQNRGALVIGILALW